MVQNSFRLARFKEAYENLQSFTKLKVAAVPNAPRMYVPDPRTMSIERNFGILQFSLTQP